MPKPNLPKWTSGGKKCGTKCKTHFKLCQYHLYSLLMQTLQVSKWQILMLWVHQNTDAKGYLACNEMPDTSEKRTLYFMLQSPSLLLYHSPVDFDSGFFKHFLLMCGWHFNVHCLLNAKAKAHSENSNVTTALSPHIICSVTWETALLWPCALI